MGKKRKNNWKHGQKNFKKRKFNHGGFGHNHQKNRRQNQFRHKKNSSQNFNKHKKAITFPSTNFREKKQQISQQPPSRFRKIREQLPVFEGKNSRKKKASKIFFTFVLFVFSQSKYCENSSKKSKLCNHWTYR